MFPGAMAAKAVACRVQQHTSTLAHEKVIQIIQHNDDEKPTSSTPRNIIHIAEQPTTTSQQAERPSDQPFRSPLILRE